MNIKVSDSSLLKGARIVQIKGRFDASIVDEVDVFLMGMIARNEIPFILDMGLVSFIGSSGIRILLALNQELKSRSQRYAIINFPSSGRKILQAMEIERLFNIFPSEKEAALFLSPKA